ncbi:aldo/keto reductase [Paraconexibacter sp.]|uniref:aldo/keto reductase n=1 Tax=Paraconexibacter sp. TaxID=2949640 RepID=UPI003563D1FA
MTSATQVPTIPLRDDVAIPQFGLGVWEIPAGDTTEVVTRALQGGYRHIDTAKVYGNEAQVGAAFRASGLERDEVFITTKCWNDDQGFDKTKRALKDSLGRLELPYVDLYLIHWPAPSQDRYVDTWKAFIELQQEGLTRSIGVSNFQPDHLHRLIEETGVTPAINQIELHPRLQQAGLRREHEDLGIITEAWSPLGKGRSFQDETIQAIAQDHRKTPAQVILRWHVQLGNVVFPRSVRPERLEENIDVFDFHLSEREMDAIAALDAGERTGPDPDVFVRP